MSRKDQKSEKIKELKKIKNLAVLCNLIFVNEKWRPTKEYNVVVTNDYII